MTRHDHDLAKKLYASPDKAPDTSPTPANIASARIDGLVRRLMTRELSFAELSASVKTELQKMLEVQNETE